VRFLVSVAAEWQAANHLDRQPSGPGPLFAYIGERFRPDAFYVEATRRTAWWVIDFADAAALTEFTHVMIARAGTYPTCVPILTGEEAAQVIPDAVAQAREAPAG